MEVCITIRAGTMAATALGLKLFLSRDLLCEDRSAISV